MEVIIYPTNMNLKKSCDTRESAEFTKSDLITSLSLGHGYGQMTMHIYRAKAAREFGKMLISIADKMDAEDAGKGKQ